MKLETGLQVTGNGWRSHWTQVETNLHMHLAQSRHCQKPKDNHAISNLLKSTTSLQYKFYSLRSDPADMATTVTKDEDNAISTTQTETALPDEAEDAQHLAKELAELRLNDQEKPRSPNSIVTAFILGKESRFDELRKLRQDVCISFI